MNNRNRWWDGVALGTIALVGVMVGCSPAEPPPATTEAAPAAMVTAPPSPVAEVSGDAPALLGRARQAMREGRLTSPAGDSATDYYLALRDHWPDDAGVTAALIELQPYVLLAAEQAIAGGDLADATRLLTAMAGIDTAAPALPRLRAGLAAAEQRIAQATAEARLAAEAITVAAARDAASRAPSLTTPPSTSPAADPGTAQPAVAELETARRPEPAPTRSTVATAVEPPVTRAPAQPRLLRDVAPRYPINALRRGLSGWVRVAFTVRPDGSVDNPQLIASQPEGVFDQAALAVARQWRFEAGTQATTIVREVRFEAPDA